jgi:hypothetical protein
MYEMAWNMLVRKDWGATVFSIYTGAFFLLFDEGGAGKDEKSKRGPGSAEIILALTVGA